MAILYIRAEDGTYQEVVAIRGSDGITPHIGSNGNWYVGETDTGVNASSGHTEPKLVGITTDRTIQDGTGAVVDIASQYWHTITADVNPSATYYIKASNLNQYAIYAIFDADGNLLTKLRAEDGDALTHFEGEITTPATASTLTISYNTNPSLGGSVGFIRYGTATNGGKYIGKNWVCIGDSLTESNERATMNYHDYIADELGFVVTNMGRSGSGYKERDDENLAFYQRVQNISSSADVVTIMGSCNDVSSGTALGAVTDTGTDTLCGCINKTLDNLINVFVGAGKIPHIGVITMPPVRDGMPSDPANAYSLYCDAIVDICKRKGIPCLDLFRCSNLRPDIESFRTIAYSRDDGGGTHPDENGHKLIAPVIQQFIETLL